MRLLIGSKETSPMIGGNVTKKLFLVDIEECKSIMHDGYIQLGFFPHSAERHIELSNSICGDNPIDWEVTYWMPDPFCNRYKRNSFQQTMKANEGSPKTDNSSDYPNQAETRLNRTV